MATPLTGFADHQRECARALLGGGKFVSRTRIEWGVSGRCSAPVQVVRYARPSGDKIVDLGPDLLRKRYKVVQHGTVRVGPGTAIPLELTYLVPCGTCEACMRFKRFMWARRCESEIKATIARGGRMWFLTLTLSPVKLNALKGIAEREALIREGIDICPESEEPVELASYWARRQAAVDTLRPEAFKKYLDRAIYREIQMYLKRLREGRKVSRKVDVERRIPPAAFRFLCVAEAHQSGEPHYHILIHEMHHAHPIRQRDIEDADWPGGFLLVKQVHFPDGKTGPAAWYICKYITKEGGRVRSSVRYGSGGANAELERSADRRAAAVSSQGNHQAPSEDSDSVPVDHPSPVSPEDASGVGGLSSVSNSQVVGQLRGRLTVLPMGVKRGTGV